MNICWRGSLLRHRFESPLQLYNQTVGNVLVPTERFIHTPSFNQKPPVAGLQIGKSTSTVYGASPFETIRISSFSSQQSSSDGQSAEFGGASAEKLAEVGEKIAQEIPMVFGRTLDYSFTHNNVVLDNRFTGKKYTGMFAYAKQAAWLRLYGHYKYAYVKLDILKLTKHTEDSSIKVRWCIRGVTGFQTLQIWKIKVWKPAELIENHGRVWLEGFSTFYINEEGLIVKHVVDRVIPEQDKQPNLVNKIVNKIGGTPKLALFLQISTDIVPHSI